MDMLKHECGVVLVRLLKPLSYYKEKYGTWRYGLNKLYLMMEKQRNRGQEGAGICALKINAPFGTDYIYRKRAEGQNAINQIFDVINQKSLEYQKELLENPQWATANIPFAADIYMGHLRYSTTGKSGLEFVHPFVRRNNWRNQSLVLCGNFNLTNTEEIFNVLVSDGQHPRMFADTYMMLELMGAALDREEKRARVAGESETNIENIIKNSAKVMDGGYVICGIIGDGDLFAFRDPSGIRPAHYYIDDEIMVLASERAVIQTAMNVQQEQVQELPAGHSMILRKDGRFELVRISAEKPKTPCSFERIYFSRGSDADIYKERKKLGELLVEPILKSVDNDLDNTVFSFIPNTAEVAFFGMIEGLDMHLTKIKKEQISQDGADIEKILSTRVRYEKVAIKDVKLRTFIADNSGRDDLAAHVYDVTYGSIRPHQDNLVVIDDSIVRGTTLKQSIIKILDRLNPKKIVIVSSSPQIRYPDCYGIDMRHMDEFVAFNAAIELIKADGNDKLLYEVYRKCKEQENLPKENQINYVKEIYEQYSCESITKKIAELLTPPDTKAKVEIVYQSIEGLHTACAEHSGDWYFSGNYPTHGGNMVVSKAYIEYYERKII